MAEEIRRVDLAGPGPHNFGWCKIVSTGVSKDKSYLRLTISREVGLSEPQRLEIDLKIPDAMALLLVLQDTQRVEGFELPKASISTTFLR